MSTPMTPQEPTKPRDADASRAASTPPPPPPADPVDRRKGPRRSGADRRAGTEPPAGVERREGDRRGPDRRRDPGVPDLYRSGERHMNEYPLLAEELEFIAAISTYKARHGRPFPTWSEVLHILRFLGYAKQQAPECGAGSDAAPQVTDATGATSGDATHR